MTDFDDLEVQRWPSNESANYRIWLAGPQVFGQGYGTEITRLVLDFALRTCSDPPRPREG